jgi:hypothetical protein
LAVSRFEPVLVEITLSFFLTFVLKATFGFAPAMILALHGRVRCGLLPFGLLACPAQIHDFAHAELAMPKVDMRVCA